MLRSKRKKILGTKYSISAVLHPNDEMEIILYFGNKKDSSMDIKPGDNVRKSLELLLSEKSYLDLESVLKDFVPFLKSELIRLQHQKTTVKGKGKKKEIKEDDSVIQIILERIINLEEKFEDITKRLESLENLSIQMGEIDARGDLPDKQIVEFTWTGQDFFKNIELLKSQGRRKEYIEALESMLQQNPENIVVQNMLGNAHLKEGDYASAGKAFEKVLKNEKNNFNALLGLAKVFHNTKRSPRALELLEHANKIVPESREVHKLFSIVHEALGDSKKSRHHSKKASQLRTASITQSDSSDFEVSSVPEAPLDSIGGVIEPHTDDVEKLESKIEETVTSESEIDTSTFEECLKKGKGFYRSRQLEPAFQMYLKATELNPDDLRGWHNLGIVAEDLGNVEKAKEAFSKALEYCQGQGDTEGEKKYTKWLSTL